MRKKIFAIAMAVAMMASLSSMAFADDVTDTIPKNTTVAYTVAPGYTVSIPASVTCTDGSTLTGLTFTASKNIIESTQTLKVIISGLETGADAGKISLVNGSDTVKIPVKLGTDACENDTTVVASFAAGTTDNSVSKSLTLDSTGVTFKYAGTYSGTLTFTLSLA